MNPMLVLATGPSGSTAHLAVSALAERGIEVRGLVHDPDKADEARAVGATDTVIGDLTDADTLRRGSTVSTAPS